MLISVEQLINRAKELTEEGQDWHHHYLPPGCSLNRNPEHQIILESGSDLWTAIVQEKPLESLKDLENLFFKGGE